MDPLQTLVATASGPFKPLNVQGKETALPATVSGQSYSPRFESVSSKLQNPLSMSSRVSNILMTENLTHSLQVLVDNLT